MGEAGPVTPGFKLSHSSSPALRRHAHTRGAREHVKKRRAPPPVKVKPIRLLPVAVRCNCNCLSLLVRADVAIAIASGKARGLAGRRILRDLPSAVADVTSDPASNACCASARRSQILCCCLLKNRGKHQAAGERTGGCEAQDRGRWLAVRAMSKTRASCKGNATFSASRWGMCPSRFTVTRAARQLWTVLAGLSTISTPSQISSWVCMSHFTVRGVSCGQWSRRPGSRKRGRRGPPAGRQGEIFGAPLVRSSWCGDRTETRTRKTHHSQKPKPQEPPMFSNSPLTTCLTRHRARFRPAIFGARS